ncbi:hypothetical protein ES703_70813 [subsurface metagenome]
MKVKMLVKNEKGEVVESYEAPDGSWIQTDRYGSLHVPASSTPVTYELKGGSITFIPHAPPVIGEDIEKILDSNDRRWGKNGYEWMGINREGQGGTTINRARELFSWAGSGLSKMDFPAELTFDQCVDVMEDEKYCKALWQPQFKD